MTDRFAAREYQRLTGAPAFGRAEVKPASSLRSLPPRGRSVPSERPDGTEMARAPRLALAGELHYLVQRGTTASASLTTTTTAKPICAMLREGAAQYRVAIHAYALLDSEVHLLATPAEADALGRLMQSIGRRYVGAFNRRHDRSGTLWEGRFRAAVIDGARIGTSTRRCKSSYSRSARVWWKPPANGLGRARHTTSASAATP